MLPPCESFEWIYCQQYLLAWFTYQMFQAAAAVGIPTPTLAGNRHILLARREACKRTKLCGRVFSSNATAPNPTQHNTNEKQTKLIWHIIFQHYNWSGCLFLLECVFYCDCDQIQHLVDVHSFAGAIHTLPLCECVLSLLVSALTLVCDRCQIKTGYTRSCQVGFKHRVLSFCSLEYGNVVCYQWPVAHHGIQLTLLA